MFGQTVASDVSEQVTDVVLTGTRPAGTYYSPEPDHPQRVYVRMVVAIDPGLVASQLASAGAREARRRQMELRHTEMLRELDAIVRATAPRR